MMWHNSKMLSLKTTRLPTSAAIFFIALFSSTSYAQVDAALTPTYRSAPQGFSADFDLGGAIVFWGDAPSKSGTSNPNPLYGYLRSEVTFTAAPDYNGWAYQFQFFPLAFVGVVAGQSFSDNEKDYAAYRCAVHLCEGEFREDFTEGRLALGYAGVFFAGYFRSSQMTENNSTSLTSYISPGDGIALKTKDDSVQRMRLILGYEISDTWSVLATYMQASAEKTEQESTMTLAGVMFTAKNKQFSASLQGGVFNAEDGIIAAAVSQQDQITALFQLKWTPLKSVALF